MSRIFFQHRWRHLGAIVAASLTCFQVGFAVAAVSDASPAAVLRSKYTALHEQLSNNQFQRPISLHSTEAPNALKGEIYALIDYPYSTVKTALNSPAHWCDVLILHLNTKYCRPSTGNAGTVLVVSIGSKNDEPLDEAYQVEFGYRVAAATSDYLQIQLNADTGPLSTRNYRIVLEAVPLQPGRTFLLLSYSYSYGVAGRLAMQAYLATIGRDKVGFTVTGKLPNGEPNYIRGMRGVVERNTMRYYLAIEAYLKGLTAPAGEQLDARLQWWFDATERYRRQLHEVDRAAYIKMKRNEYLRQQTVK